MSAAHLSTSPLPSAKKALTTVIEDEDRRTAATSHTQSLGLLSPIPSSTSITSLSPPSTASALPSSSSSCSFSSTSSSHHHHAPFTPRTPPRSTTTPRPRPSPLFRLLQPFARNTPLSAPTSPTFTTFTTPMALHHPTPQTPSASSNTAPTTDPRPSSRSERLLRDALLRDEMERPTAAHDSTGNNAGARSPSSAGKTHRRRHSHVPTSRLASPDRDELTRGTFLFRTALSNPRALSPSPPGQRQANNTLTYYGGDAEGSSSPATPMRRQRHQQAQSVSHPQQPHPSPQFKSRADSSSMGSVRSTSHSPSPMRRPRPSGLSLDGVLVPGSALGRHNSTQTRASASPSKRAGQAQAAPGEPLMMTPHEQVLRARLERVLSAGRVVEQDGRERHRETRHRQRSESRGNEVRDEEGGWPWRERAQEQSGGEGEVAVAEDSAASGPLYSTASNNSGGSSSARSLQPQNPTQSPETMRHIPETAPPSTPRMVSHSRTRSKTDPASPPPSSALGPDRRSAAPSPRRSSTAPTYASRIPTRKQSSAAQSAIPRTGTTPPLVAGADGEGEEEAEGDEGDSRLLTPPPTPPFTARMFSLSGVPLPGGGEAYCPSPYKSTYPAALHAPTRAQQQQQRSQGGFALGSPRRPRNAPVSRQQPSLSDHERERELLQDSSSCSSGRSQASFPASDTSSAYAHRARLRSRSADAQALGAMHERRPQFNARKASARCRAIEGYVSFASVEGLGEPPADPLSPDADDLERERGRAAGVFGAAWGGWLRLLNVAGVAAHESSQGASGGVVL